MAKLKFKRIEIISLLKDSTDILNRLQRRGVVQITDTDDELLTKIDGDESAKKFEDIIKKAKNALLSLDEITKKKSSVFDSLKGRIKLSSKDFSIKQSKTKETLRVIKEIEALTKNISEYKKKISKIIADIDTLKPWITSDLPLNTEKTEFVSIFFGTTDKESKKEIIKEASEKNISMEIKTVHESNTKKNPKSCEVVFVLKKDKKEATELLLEYGFSFFSYSSPLTPKNEILKLNKEKEEYEKLIKDAEEKLTAFKENYNDIEFLIDYYTLKKDKYNEVKKLAMTKSTVVIRGFVPEIYSESIKSEFEHKYPTVIKISDLNEDDNPPVLLSNNSFTSAVEGITEMYALPNKNDTDPNGVMAFFYYLFFGMMLSDAGYGLIITTAMLLLLKLTSVEGSLRRSFRMFFYCGISTFFWGALFGSWFGDLPQVISREFFNTELGSIALWFEPLTNPITLLLFSFGLGIIHLFAGLYMRFKILYESGKRTDAYLEVFPIFITVLGACPLGAGILADVPGFFKTTGTVLLLIGSISIVLTAKRSTKNIFFRFFGGIYGLYNVATGYLSDILSYSRLLALGLATGSIASVINLIAVMPESVFLKAFMLIFVGLIGHTANLGINLLGAYVHSDRLQFVELFSKFYEGGGEAFAPLKANTKYYTFEKENIYE